MAQIAIIKKEPAWDESNENLETTSQSNNCVECDILVEENAATNCGIKDHNILVLINADIEDPLCVKLETKEFLKEEQDTFNDYKHDDKDQENDLSMEEISYYSKESYVDEQEVNTHDFHRSNVIVKTLPKIEDDEYEVEENHGDPLLFKENDLALNEEPDILVNCESLIVKEEHSILEDGNEQRISHVHENDEFRRDEQTKEYSETAELDFISVDSVPDEADSENETRHCIKKTANVDRVRRFDCTQCLKSFIQKGSLIKHMRLHAGIKPFDCSVCEKSFGEKQTLIKHMRVHTGEKPFKCCECEKSFSQNQTLIQHMRVHTGEKPFNCSECQKSFRGKGCLINHLRVHTREKPFNCNECQKSFSEKGSLINHMRVHTGEKPFKCKECHKSFSCSSDLTKHVRVHTGEKPFKCTLCQKSFSQSSSLMRHMDVHTGEKPFNCSECQKSFTAKVSLIKHMRVHTGDKPFKCKECRKSFSCSSDLTKHMRVHTREKPFMCTICQKSFSQSSSLGRHRSTHRENDRSTAMSKTIQSKMWFNKTCMHLGKKSLYS